jgi:hypothetical protein
MQGNHTKLVEIVDDGLVNRGGHHYSYCSAIVDMLLKQGIKPRIWANLAYVAQSEIPAESISLLSNYCYDVPNCKDETRIARTASEYRLILNQSRGQRSKVFFPNFRLHHGLALLRCADAILHGKSFVLLLRYSEDLLGEDGTLFISVIKSIVDAYRDTQIVTDTSAFSNFLDSIGIPNSIIGIPVNTDPADTEPEAIQNDFIFLGAANPLKGFFNFLNAVIIGAQYGFTPRIACQATNLPKEVLSQFRQHSYLQHVRWIESNLSIRDFRSEILKSSCVVLPYDVAAFNYNSSGILTAALYFRKFVLTSKTKFASDLTNEKPTSMYLSDTNPETIFSAMRVHYNAQDFSVHWLNAWSAAQRCSSSSEIINIFHSDN